MLLVTVFITAIETWLGQPSPQPAAMTWFSYASISNFTLSACCQVLLFFLHRFSSFVLQEGPWDLWELSALYSVPGQHGSTEDILYLCIEITEVPGAGKVFTVCNPIAGLLQAGVWQYQYIQMCPILPMSLWLSGRVYFTTQSLASLFSHKLPSVLYTLPFI